MSPTTNTGITPSPEFIVWLEAFSKERGMHVYSYTALLWEAWQASRERPVCPCANLAGDCDGDHTTAQGDA